MRRLAAALLPLLLAACATTADFLDLPLGAEPAVYYRAPLQPAPGDTVVVAAVADPWVMDGVRSRRLRLFLRAAHRRLRLAGGPASAFLPFEPLPEGQAAELVARHPELAGRALYGLRLHRLAVRPGALPPRTTLGAAARGTLTERQYRRLAPRPVAFLCLPAAGAALELRAAAE